MKPFERIVHRVHIAYFSMEMALQSDIPTYAGGLGVLAGDTLRTAADLELPLIGVTLISRMGHFHQEFDDQGRQVERPAPWTPEKWATPLDQKVVVPIEDRSVWVRAWLYLVTGVAGAKVPVLLLDTDLTENGEADRTITHYLYGDGPEYRLKQEIVLGIGGARMLHALGLGIRVYHMNEGHSALLALELLRRYERRPKTVSFGDSIYDVSRVRKLCLFTTHTPIETGHDQFPYSLVERLLDSFIDMNQLRALAGDTRLNMTRLALNLSGYVNGVARSHTETSTAMFPGYRVHSITNGIHSATWAHPAFARLYDSHVPRWRHEPAILMHADQIPNEEIWEAHLQAKRELAETVEQLAGVELDIDLPIIGFARRMTAYKRPDLLLSDFLRLLTIANRFPFQIVIAGKAHPGDEAGRRLIETISNMLPTLGNRIMGVFLPNYDMELGRTIVSGADIWLNTPLRPLEASGTSGMKAALNGVPSLSVLDGWWAEGCIEGVTGWAIGEAGRPDANHADGGMLYQKLEETVLPLYHNDRPGWITIMKRAIAKNASYFNSHRMIRRYATDAYLR